MSCLCACTWRFKLFLKTWTPTFQNVSHGAGLEPKCAVIKMLMVLVTMTLTMTTMLAMRRTMTLTWGCAGRRGWVTPSTPTWCSSHSATFNPEVSCCRILWWICSDNEKLFHKIPAKSVVSNRERVIFMMVKEMLSMMKMIFMTINLTSRVARERRTRKQSKGEGTAPRYRWAGSHCQSLPCHNCAPS